MKSLFVKTPRERLVNQLLRGAEIKQRDIEALEMFNPAYIKLLMTQPQDVLRQKLAEILITSSVTHYKAIPERRVAHA